MSHYQQQPWDYSRENSAQGAWDSAEDGFPRGRGNQGSYDPLAPHYGSAQPPPNRHQSHMQQQMRWSNASPAAEPPAKRARYGQQAEAPQSSQQPRRSKTPQQQGSQREEQAQGKHKHKSKQEQQQEARYQQLASDIEQLIDEASPDAQERSERERVMQQVRSAANTAIYYTYPRMQVNQFGSGACGMSTHASDLDVLITGALQPSYAVGYYQSPAEKRPVVEALEKIKRQLYKSPLSSDIRSQLVIRGARIPILKLSLHSGLQVDVSICNDSGLKAVQYLQQACTTLPALRPLVLVLKLLLREHSLNDVATGGLGSWALANMVMAHLKLEQQAGADMSHLGRMLHSFLQRYSSSRFDYRTTGISLAHPRIILPKQQLGMPQEPKLCIKDPLTGREIAGGSNQVGMVQKLFTLGAGTLNEVVKCEGEFAGRLDSVLDCIMNVYEAALRSGGRHAEQQYEGAGGQQLGKRGRG